MYIFKWLNTACAYIVAYVAVMSDNRCAKLFAKLYLHAYCNDHFICPMWITQVLLSILKSESLLYAKMCVGSMYKR